MAIRMRSRVQGPKSKARGLRSEVLRASGPARTQTACAVTLALYVLAWAALPVALAARVRRASSPARNAMSVGCEKATCCTSRCYLDENGVHRCISREGESCECGLSSRPKIAGYAFSEGLQMPPADPEKFPCALPPAGFILHERIASIGHDLAVPTPPPR